MIGLVLAGSTNSRAQVVNGNGRDPLATARSVSTVDPVQQRVERIRDRFVAAIKNCGTTPTFVPAVLVDNLANGVSYQGRAVHVSRWSKLDPAVQQALQAWAAQGTLGLNAEGQWGEIFNDLLVAHELGHYLESMAHHLDNIDYAKNEIEANEIALAFWSIDQDDRQRLPARIKNYTVFLNALPSPVPTGSEPDSYFRSHYQQLQTNLAGYGWYQGQFMNKAWDNYKSRSFCDWVAANKPVALNRAQ
jgi:hypothetical protein